MSIQPVTKAAEHNYLTNSILVLKKKQEKERKKKAVKAYLIKNSKGEEGEGGGTITSSRKDWAEYYITVHPM